MMRRWLPVVVAWGFLIAIVASGADSIPHPTPATDDAVSIGNGTKWVSTAVPSCSGTNNVLRYDSSANTFSCSSARFSGFTAICFDSACANMDVPPVNGFIGSVTGVSGNVTGVSCNWKTAGTGSGLVVEIYDVTSSASVCTCSLGSCTGTFTPHSCACSGALTAAREYVAGFSGTSTCTGNPGQVACNVGLGP